MPFCTNCGNQVGGNARFCAACGSPQAADASPRAQSAPGVSGPGVSGPFDGIRPRTASILCYIPVFGVIPAIIVLASQRFRRNAEVRFDAFQSVYLFVAWLVVSSVMPVFLLGLPDWDTGRALFALVKFIFFICWIVLLVKAIQEQRMHLPIIGDLAARSTAEQR